jgi:hypothetical protein
VAGDLASRAAVCLDNAPPYERERRTARALQRGLLPGRPKVPAGVQVAYRYLPVGDSVVGGDWHDVGALPGGRAALIVGDAMGHGPEAATVMVQLHTAAHTLADLDPLRTHGGLIGMASFWRWRPGPYQPEELAAATELAVKAAIAIDNGRRYARERPTALTLQRSLLPQQLNGQAAAEVTPLPARRFTGRRRRGLVRRNRAVGHTSRHGHRGCCRPWHPCLGHHGSATHRRAHPG